MAELKEKTKCNRCGKYEHRATDHKCDGYEKFGFKSLHAPANKSKGEKNVISFNMAQISSLDSLEYENVVGLLLDNAAPYSGIGLVELNRIKDCICPE